MKIERRRVAVGGVVQGVGFRPFVYTAAKARGLRGFVRNGPAGVLIEVEGPPDQLDDFIRQVSGSPPPAALVERCEQSSLPVGGEVDFSIQESGLEGARSTLISPDLATCSQCVRELRDPADRRHGYPFINCTHCGPRFTIIIDIPYDRERTSMSTFELCPACRKEYKDPSDRRFHAEPVACPACGPSLEFVLMGPETEEEAGQELKAAADSAEDPLEKAVALLRAGGVVGVKGIGGFQLACDARNPKVVDRLRKRKHRPAKPLAVMVRDIGEARLLAEIDPVSSASLSAPAAPIVLLPRGEEGGLAPGIAPDTDQVGLMLPTSPLHHLLLERFGGPLVMTSGNASEEPIAMTNGEALSRLSGIADSLLQHNRDIVARYDDSVVRVLDGKEVVVRRARGFAPRPLELPLKSPREILAVGGYLKSTFCLVQGGQAFLSQHLGDLDSPLTLENFEATLAHYIRIFEPAPEIVAHDLHPDYLSTRLAEKKAAPRGRIAVQHHHAHVASCLAEHGQAGPAIGVSFDGAGYGPDGTIWGGEILVADLAGYRRAAALELVPLPGGEAAMREPWRMAAAYLLTAFGEDFLDLPLKFNQRLDRTRWKPLAQAVARGLNSPRTSSAGRLFDAVASLIGICHENLYEGHAAVRLEALARTAAESEAKAYPIHLSGGELIEMKTAPLIQAVVEDLRAGVPAASIAARFHGALQNAVQQVCLRIKERTGIDLAVLTGGVFQNKLLLEGLAGILRKSGFQVLTHQRVPPNDGGIAYGQAAVAAEVLRRRGGGS